MPPARKLPSPFAARATGVGIVLMAATFFSPAVVAGLGTAALAGHLVICRARMRELDRLARLQDQDRQVDKQ